jgi:hypothetical protein
MRETVRQRRRLRMAPPSPPLVTAPLPARHPGNQTAHRADRYLSWDDYFMAVAFLSAQRSKDPNKQVQRRTRDCTAGMQGGAPALLAPCRCVAILPLCLDRRLAPALWMQTT